MPASRQTIAAASAHHMPLAAHQIARAKIADVRSNLHDFADEFMPDRHRHRNGALRPFIPVVNVNVGAADSRAAYANQNIIDPDGWFGNIFEPQSGLTFAFDKCRS